MSRPALCCDNCDRPIPRGPHHCIVDATLLLCLRCMFAKGLHREARLLNRGEAWRILETAYKKLDEADNARLQGD